MINTPETDNLARGNHVVPTSWAEQLERQRDEARIQEDIHYQNYLQMQRERDEAREQLAIAKAERNAAHLKCHRIAEEIMAWLADPQPNNTTPPATSK